MDVTRALEGRTDGARAPKGEFRFFFVFCFNFT